MNPLTNMKNVKKLSEQDLHRSSKSSWHNQYKDSAWIFVGGLPYDLTEGDIICIFSQFGEVVNINLVRDKDTGKSKGFCFICFEDQKSTVLTVDNFNGIKILGRTIRVDHVSDYKVPKQSKKTDAETRQLYDLGCGPNMKPEKKPTMPIPSTELPAFAREEEAPPDGFRLPPRLPIDRVKIEKVEVKEEKDSIPKVKVKKEKKSKKSKKKKSKKKSKRSSSESDTDSSSDENKLEIKVKREMKSSDEEIKEDKSENDKKYRDRHDEDKHSRKYNQQMGKDNRYNDRRYDTLSSRKRRTDFTDDWKHSKRHRR